MVREKVLEWDIALFRLGHVPVSGRPVFMKKKKISRQSEPNLGQSNIFNL